MGLLDFFTGSAGQEKRDEIISESQKVQEDTSADEEDGMSTGDPELDMKLNKINAQLEALQEFRKTTSERFNMMSEQRGELRGMVTDLSQSITKIEASASKAVDLVESVEPEKLMSQVRKQDSKIESLRAQLDSKDARMQDMFDEIKRMREQMDVYQGLEQVQQLNDEMKDELSEMRKMQATIKKHADRVDSIFVDVNEKFKEFSSIEEKVDDLQNEVQVLQQDMDELKVNVEEKADRDEFVDLMDKFSDFQEHTDNVLDLMEQRSKEMKTEMADEFDRIKALLEEEYGIDYASEIERLEEEGKVDHGEGMLRKLWNKAKGVHESDIEPVEESDGDDVEPDGADEDIVEEEL